MMGVATAASTPSGLAVGADNTMLVADSVAATGVKWANIVDANITTGTITLARLANGTSAQYHVCNVSGVPVYVAMSGDITQTNAGVTAIGAGKVTNTMLSTATGAPGGAWQTAATTFTNITNVTGTTRWRQVGKTVNFNITATFSAAPVISGASPQVTLPVARQGFQDSFTIWYYKTSTAIAYQGGGPFHLTSTSFRLLATTNGVAFGAPITGSTIVTATFPFTFANTDQIFISGTYEAA
jgi:hypothetical protein